MRFPLVGSCVLFGLFLLFKFLPARYVNALLSFYLGGVAVFVLMSAVTPYIKDFFPEVRHGITMDGVRQPVLAGCREFGYFSS